jgi:predicted Zn-dependent protease
MKKVIIQGVITVALFFASWFVLRQIDWVTIFKVQEVTDSTEEKLGELFWDFFQRSEKESTDSTVVNSVDSLVTKICLANNIDKELIRVHILRKDDINAFALPDGHLVIYSGLILNSDNQEELSGVICHELAHIQLNHVMKKLIKEIGLSVLISMTTGNGNANIIRETARMLSSSAFDRTLEKEADMKAVDYLVAANINPEPLANFLYKLHDNNNEVAKYLTWVSTHPDSRERAKDIIEYSKDRKSAYEAILSEETWHKLKETLKE